MSSAAKAIALAGALVGITTVCGAAAADTVRLDIQSAWPLTMPASGTNAEFLGEQLNAASGGTFRVKVYSAGKLVPPLQIFDAVQQGTLDAGYTSPLYVAGRFPAVQLFGGVPFGPDAITYTGWLYDGGGREIWSDIYEKQGVVTIPCGLMDSESGGWYNFRIESIDDFKGKKLRFAGLAGEVLAKHGASVVLLSGGDIYPSLEKGIIDGTELSMPAIDETLGLEDVAKYYYLPGWHQPAAMNELIINKRKWDEMDDSAHALIEDMCLATNMRSIISTVVSNAEAVSKFEEKGTEIMTFPPAVLDVLEATTADVMAEQAESDPDFKRVWDSLQAYRDQAAPWADRRSN
ncbi:MAG: C4-dicarboxylate ABC transporter substrate-binding protein [Rhizobiaceae bacterium]|nr:C4-dicarboxylate ABC transporter substrate-binding protein [Rhizobiaceae bacterium]